MERVGNGEELQAELDGVMSKIVTRNRPEHICSGARIRFVYVLSVG